MIAKCVAVSEAITTLSPLAARIESVGALLPASSGRLHAVEGTTQSGKTHVSCLLAIQRIAIVEPSTFDEFDHLLVGERTNIVSPSVAGAHAASESRQGQRDPSADEPERNGS
jgi:hypothetical protein